MVEFNSVARHISILKIVYLCHNQIEKKIFLSFKNTKYCRININKTHTNAYPFGRFRLWKFLALRVSVLITLLLELFVLRKTLIHPAYHSQLPAFHSNFCLSLFRDEIGLYLYIFPDPYQA